MFNIFKRKDKITSKDYTFLKVVIEILPSKYEYLVDQVSENFILGKKPNRLGEKGSYVFSLNADLESKFSNKSLPQFFIVKDIGIWNTKRGSFEELELHILEGMLAGFKLVSNYSDLNFNEIDTSKIKEKHFRNEDKNTLKQIIGRVDRDVLAQIDVESTFKIEIPEGNFYVIKELGDGNYLSMNSQGAVYGLIHDPYEVDKIFENKRDFFDALKSGSFNIVQYYREKTTS